MIDITIFITAVAGAIAGVFCYFVRPYIKAVTSAEQQAVLNEWVRTAVKAAEQIYKGSGRGDEKKAFVLDWLQDHKITFDAAIIDAIIEAAVYELNEGLI